MGNSVVNWCDNCGAQGETTKWWAQTDAQRRSTDHDCKKVDLCSSCLESEQARFKSLLKYLSAPLHGI